MSTFGGSENNFTVPQIKNDGAQFWTKVDATTGKTTVYRRYPGPSIVTGKHAIFLLI